MITIGRINTRKTSRTHMALNGKTFCGSGNRAPIRHIAKTYRDIERASICKSCFTPANLTVAQIEVATGRFSAALDDFLCDLRLVIGYGTPPSRPALAVAPLRFQVRIHNGDGAQSWLARKSAPVTKELSAWGAMANGFRKTHPVAA